MKKLNFRAAARVCALVPAALLATALTLSACSSMEITPADLPDEETDRRPADTQSIQGGSIADADTVVLTFSGTSLSASVEDCGIEVAGNAFVITRGGSYELRGDLSNGQVKVAVGKGEDVELILNNFTASCNASAPLYIESANKAVIYLTEGSENHLTDAVQYQYPSADEDKPNACLYAADDLTIKGTGTLYVTGRYNNGIGCRNDLRIRDCTLYITAPNNILKGNDSVEIEAATLTLSGGEDAIKSDTVDRADKGYILIAAGTRLSIQCSDDALQATQSITVEPDTAVLGICGANIFNCPGAINADPYSVRIDVGG